MLQVAHKLSQISLALNHLTEGVAVYELHRNEVHTVALPDFIDVSDIRMIQSGRGFRLAHKPLHPIAIRCQVRRQSFQRDFAIKFCVLREVHFAHATCTNPGDNAIVGKARVGG